MIELPVFVTLGFPIESQKSDGKQWRKILGSAQSFENPWKKAKKVLFRTIE